MSKMQSEKSHLLRDSLYNVLIVLGMDQDSWLKKLNCTKLTIHRNMFQYPKSNIFQAVSYFLFSILDSQKCFEDFHYCWPVGTKKEEREFRKICFSWLTKLSQEEGSHFPKFTPTILVSPGLDKFCHLYLAIARLALKKVFIQEYKEVLLYFPKLNNSDFNHSVFEIILASKHRFLQIYKDKEEAGRKRNDAFLKNAKILIGQNHQLRKESEKYERDRLQNCKILNQEKNMIKARQLWTEINKFANLSRETTVLLESILGISSTSNELDGQENIIEPSNNFIMQHGSKLEAASIDRIYERGIVQITNLFKLMEIILQSYYDSLKKVAKTFTASSEIYIPIFANLAACYQSNFKSLVEIDNKLERTLVPEIQNSVRKFEDQFNLKSSSSFLQDTSSNSSLDILRISPILPNVLKKHSDIWTKTVQFTPVEKVKDLRAQSDLGCSPSLENQMKEKKFVPITQTTETVEILNCRKSKIPTLTSRNKLTTNNPVHSEFGKNSPLKKISEAKLLITPKKHLINDVTNSEIEVSNMIKITQSNNFSPVIMKCISSLKESTNFTLSPIQSGSNIPKFDLISSLDEDFMNESLPLPNYNLLDCCSPNASAF